MQKRPRLDRRRIAAARVLCDVGEFDRFDFGPLLRALREIRHPTPEIQESNAGTAPLSHLDIDPTRDLPTCDTSPAVPIEALVEGRQIDEVSSHSVVDRVDHCSDTEALAFWVEPRMLRGRYALAAEIGRGGGGTVYRALDLNRAGLPREDQYVAVKLLHAEASRRPDAVQALRCEYHWAQLLSHPGIVNVFDFDHEGGIYFVVMELLDGESLGALIRRLQPNTPARTAIRLLRELGDAVAYAHDRGVLHLDLKPDNVMIDAEGHVRVLDFGLAQRQTTPWPSGNHASPAAATPAYASCERLVQERPDVRDDIFSFSCVAYELLPEHIRSTASPHSALAKRGSRCDASTACRAVNGTRCKAGWPGRGDRPANMRELLQGLALQSRVPSKQRPPEWRGTDR